MYNKNKKFSTRRTVFLILAIVFLWVGILKCYTTVAYAGIICFVIFLCMKNTEAADSTTRYGRKKSSTTRTMSPYSQASPYEVSSNAYKNSQQKTASNNNGSFGNRNPSYHYGSSRYSSSASQTVARSTSYNTAANSNIKISNSKYDINKLDGCNPNVCPICKRVLVNGYCSDCGYRLKH